ncbi:monofunctional biosynthetic peptidoglycan transglycosylase [Halomonas halocynthiae]|uniref:monofunctional biosynthetic peptidoglycan transglycosylase n=1 Tax=Halomonas halocynthiae TaxID=176290 RepID=UPI00040851E3|nr:monofunctional biosynthetic peptidoglycan transglycosylase [Halomonas halocynthiae]
MSALIRKIARWLMLALLGWVAFSVLVVLMLRVVPLPYSMVMLERKVQSLMAGEWVAQQQQWRPLSELSPNAQLAVIASEDQRFPSHRGIDFIELRRAIVDARRGDKLRGASTLSQQTAKNVFLWTGRSWVRKLLEVWFTLLIEALWSKERILEVYLNIAEWDDGVFGLEAAAQHYVGVSADQLSAVQASRLAAILPNPREWSASHPSAYVERRAQWIRQQMDNLGQGYLKRL